MFFDKDKKIGKNLAVAAVALCEPALKHKFKYRSQFSKIENLRFRFCLSILNIVTAIWWVNFHEHNKGRARKIIDSLLEAFMDAFKKDPIIIRIGDYIIDSSEKSLIEADCGIESITDETRTSLGTILPIVYNIRAVQYLNALNERAKMSLDKEKAITFRSSNPIAKLFIKHFSGQDWEYQVDWATELSLVLDISIMSINDFVKEVVGIKKM